MHVCFAWSSPNPVVNERRARQSFHLQARLGDCHSYPSAALHSRAEAHAPPSCTQLTASRSSACLSLITCPLFPLPFLLKHRLLLFRLHQLGDEYVDLINVVDLQQAWGCTICIKRLVIDTSGSVAAYSSSYRKCALGPGVEAVGWVSVVFRYEESALVSSGGNRAVSDWLLLGR